MFKLLTTRNVFPEWAKDLMGFGQMICAKQWKRLFLNLIAINKCLHLHIFFKIKRANGWPFG
jgi:hypothetical protein